MSSVLESRLSLRTKHSYEEQARAYRSLCCPEYSITQGVRNNKARSVRELELLNRCGKPVQESISFQYLHETI